MNNEYTVDLDAPPQDSLELLAATAEDWGGGWESDGPQSGRLAIPVLAGLRRGFVVGRVDVEAAGEGSRLRFQPEESHYHVQKPAVVILLLAAFGGLLTIAGLFVPSLLPLVPVGALLAVASWLVVVVRLRNTGPEEFFQTLAGWRPEEDSES